MKRSPMMMVMILGLVYVARKYLDAENPMHLWGVRLLYVTVQLLCVAMVAYFHYKAKNTKEPGLVTVKEDLGFGVESENQVKITISEHDLRECKLQFQRIFFGALVTVFLHYKWGFVPPLLIQSIVHPITLYNSPIARVYLRGQRAWGDLKRPWEDPAKNFPGNWQAVSETWSSAMNGTPVIRRNTKEKKSKKKRH